MNQKKRILLVDDAKTMRMLLSLALKNAGFDIIEAENGNDALKKLDDFDIEMVITDVIMPEMDGIELIRHIRANPKYRFIPIIMMTAETEKDDDHAGMRAGATAWISKPFKPEQLLKLIGRFIR
jgi:two-component system chemotaxis response regulator CheY